MAQFGLEQRGQGDGVAVAAEGGGQLHVEQVAGRPPGAVEAEARFLFIGVDDVRTAGSVIASQIGWSTPSSASGSIRKTASGGGDLEQCQLGVVGAFGDEFGVQAHDAGGAHVLRQLDRLIARAEHVVGGEGG